MKKILYVLLLASALGTLCISPVCAAEPELKDSELSQSLWIDSASKNPMPNVGLRREMEIKSEMNLASWWNSFGDNTLTYLIMTAMQNNRNMANAISKVREARASLGISKAALLPWFDSSNYWQMSRNAVEGNGSRTDVTRLGIDASWEIDIFGGRRQTIKAETANMEAIYADMYSTWTSLAAEVAINYISLCTLQQRLVIAQENVVLQSDSRDMLKSRYEAGLSDALALSQAEYTLKQTESMIPPLKTEIEATKNRLAILTGLVPGELEEIKTDGIPEQIDASILLVIPSDTLRQRADIRAAEKRLASQISRKKAAQADMWPKFYLTGAFGTELSTGNLFEGANKFYSFGPRITLPIFHWGAIRKNINVQKEKQIQAFNNYEQTILNATGEVRNALTSLTQEYNRRKSLKEGADAAYQAMILAEDKYKNGIVDYNNVISAQKAYLSLSEEYIVSLGQISIDTVGLYKSLGGGWGAFR